jgi:hypothetical protein
MSHLRPTHEQKQDIRILHLEEELQALQDQIGPGSGPFMPLAGADLPGTFILTGNGHQFVDIDPSGLGTMVLGDQSQGTFISMTPGNINSQVSNPGTFRAAIGSSFLRLSQSDHLVNTTLIQWFGPTGLIYRSLFDNALNPHILDEVLDAAGIRATDFLMEDPSNFGPPGVVGAGFALDAGRVFWVGGPSTFTGTPILLFKVTSGGNVSCTFPTTGSTVKAIDVGVANSGGLGFRQLIVPN